MILTVHIPNQQTRIAFAAKVRQIIPECTTYIPGNNSGIYTSDIGIKASVTKKELAQINALIEKRGFECTSHESNNKNRGNK